MADRQVSAGEVGYLICGIKTLADAKVGDTMHKDKPAEEPLKDSLKSNQWCTVAFIPLNQKILNRFGKR